MELYKDTVAHCHGTHMPFLVPDMGAVLPPNAACPVKLPWDYQHVGGHWAALVGS